MIFYISDLHFGHQNVIRFDKRPFETISQMDYTLIQLWNSRVRNEDTVYIVGDFAYRNEKPEEWYLRQLQGKKHLLVGNHDNKLLSNPAAVSYFESIEKMTHVTDGKHQICLCHFPICEWNGYRKGHLHIYGHIHNRREDTFQIMCKRKGAFNAGCMINAYMPVPLDELIRNNQEFGRDTGNGDV
ncbi:MAG: hydrolase [Lachnospiraceae bacterium]|jgi:calcineurin-like phosphoesterase family protein|nr:hydrolase [Lachnospiraceae bacterium]